MDAPTDLGPAPGAPTPPDPPRGWTGPRRLRRRPDDGHIAGVCAGVAEYFNVDPIIVRIAAVVLLFSGPGFFAYVLAWIFVPAEEGPAQFGTPQAPIDRKDRGTQIFGIVLLGLGVSLFWGDWWAPARGWIFPIGLMALGGWLLLRDDKDDDGVPWVPPVPPVPPVPSWTAAGQGTEAAAESTEPTDPTDSTATADATTGPAAFGSGGSWGGPPTAPWDVPPSPSPVPVPPITNRRRHLLGPIVFGVLLLWTGLAWLTGAAVETGLAGGLLILGLGFVLGSFVGGSRALILPAIAVAGALAITAVVDIPLSGPVGQQRWAPEELADVEDLYDVSMGEGTLDLSAIDVPPGDELKVRATVGLGHLVVLVADGQAVEVTTDVGAGESNVLGLQQNGIGVATDQQDGTSAGTLVLDLQVGMGQVEVRRVGAESTTSTTVLG